MMDSEEFNNHMKYLADLPCPSKGLQVALAEVKRVCGSELSDLDLSAIEKLEAEFEVNSAKRKAILSQVRELSGQVPLTREHLNKIQALYKELKSTPL